MDDPAATLRSFDASLSALETTIAPLFDQSLNTLRDGLDGIDRAKLDVLLAYTINNLVWSECHFVQCDVSGTVGRPRLPSKSLGLDARGLDGLGRRGLGNATGTRPLHTHAMGSL